MRPSTSHVMWKSVIAVSISAVLASCGAQQGFSTASSAVSRSSYATHLTDPSTQVDVQNNWTAAISGSGSASCWTISPTLPIVGAGDTAGPITLTYTFTTGCPIPSALGISYGPAAFTGQRCTFYTTYNASGFTFSVTQSDNTACSIKYPPTVSAIFSYAQKASGSGRRAPPQPHHLSL
jgi:hypothetical protein